MAVQTPELEYDFCETAFGPCLIARSGRGLVRLEFLDDTEAAALRSLGEDYPGTALRRAPLQSLVDAVFSGAAQDWQLDPAGTPFQRQVWDALRQIPHGETCSYGDIANRLANPKAVRAVGAANGRNPIAIIVPCHRVIGANGTLTGYAGGLDRKSWLLNHEGVTLKPASKPNPVEQAQGLLFE